MGFHNLSQVEVTGESEFEEWGAEAHCQLPTFECIMSICYVCLVCAFRWNMDVVAANQVSHKLMCDIVTQEFCIVPQMWWYAIFNI